MAKPAARARRWRCRAPCSRAAVVAPPRPRCLCSAAPLCDARQLDDEAGLLSLGMEMPSPVGPRLWWHRRGRAASAAPRRSATRASSMTKLTS
eukprot:scaffold3115_cov23-Phaeocystis_antarctica.AAC.1